MRPLPAGEVFAGGECPPIPQCQVVLVGTALIGMTFDHDRDGRIRAQDFYLRIHHVTVRGTDREPVIIEMNRGSQRLSRTRAPCFTSTLCRCLPLPAHPSVLIHIGRVGDSYLDRR